MADVTAAEIEQGLTDMRVVIRDWRPLDKNPDMAIGTVANPHGLAAELKREIDSYPSFGPVPFRIRIKRRENATVDRPATMFDPGGEKVQDDLGNWWHLAPQAPAATCGNCGAGLTWAYSTSAWARADEPERGREICKHPDGTWKPHVPATDEGTCPGGC
jgi:hypothetical protein